MCKDHYILLGTILTLFIIFGCEAEQDDKEGKNIMSIEDFEKGYSRELEIIRNKFSKNIN